MHTADNREIVGSNPTIPIRSIERYKVSSTSGLGRNPLKVDRIPLGLYGRAPWMVGTTVSETVRFRPLAMVVRFHLLPTWKIGRAVNAAVC